MSQGLFIDTLNPPAPAALLADMRGVGAVAVGLYVLRRDASGGLLTNGTWTAEHVRQVLAAGYSVLPIAVPGNHPLDSDVLLALENARAIGCPVGPIAVDLETWSFPPRAWVQRFVDAARGAGWRPLRYGDLGPLTGYPSADGDWISHGLIPVRSDRLFPMPALPVSPGVVADQYTVGVVLNGSDYDGSVFELSVFTAAGLPPPAGEDAMGNFVPYDRPADPAVTQAFGEVYASGGEAYWGVYPGGAGDALSYTGGLTPLGSPEDAKDLVDASGMHAWHEGVQRLHIRGVRRDGTRWLALYDAHTYSELEPWVQLPSSPPQQAPAASSAVAPHRHPVTTAGTSGDAQA